MRYQYLTVEHVTSVKDGHTFRDAVDHSIIAKAVTAVMSSETFFQAEREMLDLLGGNGWKLMATKPSLYYFIREVA